MKKVLSYFKYFGLRFLFYKYLQFNPYIINTAKDLFWPSLVSRSLSQKFIDTFNGEQGHGIDVVKRDYLGLGMVHYSFIRMTRPKRVLCVGSLRGFIPAICALACADNKYGQVDFVDAGYGEESDKSWGADGFWRKVDPAHHFQQLGLTRIKPHIMTNREFVRKFSNRTYQYIYIDGDHSYAGAKLDYNLFWPKLEKFGYLSFHDILGQGKVGGAEFGVAKLWSELPDRYKIELRFPSASGLGILQKR